MNISLSVSPSSRREWIEIIAVYAVKKAILSPSSRREWIEIISTGYVVDIISASPSSRREWIEI